MRIDAAAVRKALGLYKVLAVVAGIGVFAVIDLLLWGVAAVVANNMPARQ